MCVTLAIFVAVVVGCASACPPKKQATMRVTFGALKESWVYGPGDSPSYSSNAILRDMQGALDNVFRRHPDASAKYGYRGSSVLPAYTLDQGTEDHFLCDGSEDRQDGYITRSSDNTDQWQQTFILKNAPNFNAPGYGKYLGQFRSELEEALGAPITKFSYN